MASERLDQQILTPRLVALLAARGLLVSASFGAYPFLAVLLSRYHGFALSEVGLLVSASIIAARIGSLPAGLLVDRIGAAAVLILSSATSAILTFLLSLEVLTGQFAITLLILVLQGFSIVMHVVSLRVAVPHLVRVEELSSGFAFSEIARILGKLVGPVTTMSLVAAQQFEAAFAVAAGFYLAGMVAGLLALIGNTHDGQAAAFPGLDGPVEDHAWSITGWLANMATTVTVFAIAIAGITQINIWLPMFMDELGQPEHASYVLVLSSVIAGPGLLLIAPRLKTLSDQALINTMILGVGGFATSLLLVPHLLAHAGPMLLIFAAGLIAMEIAVAPTAQLLLARRTSPHRRGLSFGLFGVGEAIGGVLGAILGARLYETAVKMGEQAAYWTWSGWSLLIALTIVAIFHYSQKPEVRHHDP